MDYYHIQEVPIDVAACLAHLADPAAGAQAVFLGVVRNEFEGRPSSALTYEAYTPLALREMERLGEALKEEFSALHVVMVHRLGTLKVGEASVLVAVSAAHREMALRACQAGIDRLKATVPIFKQEHWAEGDPAWHGEPGGPPVRR
jgi:molybdopterin synthase catalytic subunit